MSDEAGPTPAEHVQELFARVQNPFDVSDSVLAELDTAVMHQVELQGWRHRNTPLPALRCSSHRHVFLLADGSSVTLWELRYDSEDGAGERLSEIYDDEQALRLSEQRVHQWSGGGPQSGGGPFRSPGGFADFADLADIREPGGAGRTGGFHDFGDFVECGEPGDSGGSGGFSEPGVFGEFGDFTGFAGFVEHADAGDCGDADFPAGPGSPEGDEGIPDSRRRHREYAEDGSREHARRLLRRAENPDRPGEETLRLLATAKGHEITQVPRPHTAARGWHVWCSVYEHAFLLGDGREFSLYELEHNLSATGRLVCEVYPDQHTADRAAYLLAGEQEPGWGHDDWGP